jgi:CheY-like chemotaxis protein
LSGADSPSSSAHSVDSVGSNREQLYVVISVQDRGIGISAAKQKKLFSAFSQADASIASTYGGTGLGLSIVKQLCQMMGGEVTLNSDEGKGSTFTVYLPLQGVPVPVEPSPKPTEETQPTSQFSTLTVPPNVRGLSSSSPLSSGACSLNRSPSGSISAPKSPSIYQPRGSPVPPVVSLELPAPALTRPSSSSPIAPSSPNVNTSQNSQIIDCPPNSIVVCADDTAMNRKLLQRLLEKWSEGRITLVMAEDGQEAIDACLKHNAKVLVTDIHMPNKTGIEAARELRAMPAFATLPIVCISADAMTDFDDSTRKLFTDFITKPFNLEKLRNTIRELLCSD